MSAWDDSFRPRGLNRPNCSIILSCLGRAFHVRAINGWRFAGLGLRPAMQSSILVESDLAGAAPGARAHANMLCKDAGKMALVSKAGSDGDLGERLAMVLHQDLRDLDSMPQQPSVRRQAGGLAECAREMADRQSTLGCDLLQRDIALQ